MPNRDVGAHLAPTQPTVSGDDELIAQAQAWVIATGQRCDAVLTGRVYEGRVVIACDNGNAGYPKYTVGRDVLVPEPPKQRRKKHVGHTTDSL